MLRKLPNLQGGYLPGTDSSLRFAGEGAIEPLAV
jgi:hypothetical protein